MSPSTSTTDRGTVSTTPSLPGPLKAGAFWSAVLLPFCALFLIASGLDTPAEYLSFVGLIVANLVALVVGHDYGQ